jgi:hypothetical protein
MLAIWHASKSGRARWDRLPASCCGVTLHQAGGLG